MINKISIRQFFDILEILEVHDALKKIAHEKALQEAKQQK